MDALVTQQEDLVNTIEASAAQVAGDTEAGYVGYRQYHMLFFNSEFQARTDRKGC